MLISVIVPTHNRQLLLKEAIASVVSQSNREWELVVVDDASTPQVVLDAPTLAGSDRIHLLRNHQAMGPSGARNEGIQAAHGDLVTFLDDDDLLKTDALELIDAAFRKHQDLDCLFINVDPFGEGAEGTRENQENALQGLLGKLDLNSRATKGLLPLPENLFEVMLDSVPMAFQRVAIRRTELTKVGSYKGRGFDDIEFYYRVALRCRCALLVDPVYRPRCGGQSYFSQNDARQSLIDASIRIRKGLLKLPEVTGSIRRKRRVRRALADARFNRVYFSYVEGRRFLWRDYFASCAAGITWPHISLLTKFLAGNVFHV
jgi:glycosyltransferase involved in cell wall biosynthesis